MFWWTKFCKSNIKPDTKQPTASDFGNQRNKDWLEFVKTCNIQSSSKRSEIQ